MSTKRRILFAAVDLGWRIDHYTKFLENKYGNSVLVKSFVKHRIPSTQYNTNYDYHIQYANYPSIIQWLYSFFFFIFALIKFDTFYFISGETILTRKLRGFEFGVYKFFNKRLIMHFVGSDIRDESYLYWKSEHISEYLKTDIKHDLTSDWQKKLIQDSLRYADNILVSTPDLLDIIPTAQYYPVVIDIPKFRKESSEAINKDTPFFKTKKIKILHAPSNVKLKGSEAIASILKEIENETGLIEFIYTKDLERPTNSVYTVSRYELFQLFDEADIVIDQMIIGWYGLQSIEGLLSDCELICYIEDKYESQLFENCPIQNSNLKTLNADILNLIKNWKRDEEMIEKSKNWVLNHHTIEKNNAFLVEALDLPL